MRDARKAIRFNGEIFIQKYYYETHDDIAERIDLDLDAGFERGYVED